MSFESSLGALLKDVPGAVAAVLMGFDGIPVSEVRSEDPSFSLQDVLVEYGQLMNEALKVAQAHDLGGMEEVVFSSGRFRLIFRVLNSTYFVCMLLKQDGNVGKGRYLLRRNSEAIRAEL